MIVVLYQVALVIVPIILVRLAILITLLTITPIARSLLLTTEVKLHPLPKIIYPFSLVISLISLLPLLVFRIVPPFMMAVAVIQLTLLLFRVMPLVILPLFSPPTLAAQPTLQLPLVLLRLLAIPTVSPILRLLWEVLAIFLVVVVLVPLFVVLFRTLLVKVGLLTKIIVIPSKMFPILTQRIFLIYLVTQRIFLITLEIGETEGLRH